MTDRTRSAAFIEAIALLRQRPDWTDEELAGQIGLHAQGVRHVIPAARRQVAADTPATSVVTSTGQWTP